MNTQWQIEFYIDEDGNEPVKDFILTHKEAAAEIIHVFQLLREFNISLTMPYIRKVHESGIRELKIKHRSDIYRIFFFAYGMKRFILLHAILKKTRRTPPDDIALAVVRRDNHIARHS
jgi:phage-related protein